MDRLLINCDIGEWDAQHVKLFDHKLIPYIDLCNIATGVHAGSRTIMKYTIQLAKTYYLKIGAHPSYNDRANFGRVSQKISAKLLSSQLKEQIDHFIDICNIMDAKIYHIKPHGALYHDLCDQIEMVEMFCTLIKKYYSNIKIICRSDSMLARYLMDRNIDILTESFIDRRYTGNLKLLSRSEPTSVITDIQEAISQYKMLANQEVSTPFGIKRITSDTGCIHGDNPSALLILKEIKKLSIA